MPKQIITAFYDSREYANNAALMLRQAGIPAEDITVSPQTAGSAVDATGAYADTADYEAKGFWASLEDMFGGSDDHRTYAEGLRRGGTMVTVRVNDAQVDDAVNILEKHGSVDLNEREATWRNEGWSGTTALASTRAMDQGTPAVAAPRAEVVTSSRPTAGATTASGRQDDVVQVVEEQLNVGKRAVNRGTVRVHSYVVETPVSETVNLRDETIKVERRPVDRALSSADLGANAFKDRTIELQETDEEAVVAKTARVVEEIGIRKEVNDRAETVRDTVRSTKVDIDDTRTAGAPRSGLTSGFASRINDGMEVVGSDRQHVGIVDRVDGSNLKLKKMDSASAGQHHLIPIDWIAAVDTKIGLKTTAAEAKSRWTSAG
jgi:uncharacterized protein (TIGR02271 family)